MHDIERREFSAMNTWRTIIFFLCMVTPAVGQTTHPFGVAGAGGGRSTVGDRNLLSSVGLPVGVSDSGTTGLASGFVPGAGVISGSNTVYSATTEMGWNMVSVPLLVSNYSKTSLYPTATTEAFTFSSSAYVIRDTLENGAGYWVKFGGSDTIGFPGTALTADTITVEQGWNMVGSVGYSMLASTATPIAPITILTAFHRFSNSTGYEASDTLQPGKAYWVKVSDAGQIVLRSGSLLSPAARSLLATRKANDRIPAHKKDLPDDTKVITVKDARGHERVLFVSGTPVGQNDLTRHELPPPPPEGIFDVRFGSGRDVEVATDEAGEFPIQVNGARFPLVMEWSEIPEELSGKITISYFDRPEEVHHFNGSNQITISARPASVSLQLTESNGAGLPTEFALHQNFPNPFNPSTTIAFELPDASLISVKLYNALGQNVATVIEGQFPAGRYREVLNLHTLASGIYFYSIEARPLKGGARFSEQKKMILLK